VALSGRRSTITSKIAPRVTRDAHELRLGAGRELEVHASDRSLREVEGDVRLRHRRIQTVGRELALAEGPREEAPAVGARLGFHDERALQLGLGEDHGTPWGPARGRDGKGEASA
jgi:hypothetical protein